MPSTLTFARLSFAWPDGRDVFRDLTFALPAGLSGLVGRNGIGKSTLLRLAAGALAPTSGAITRPERLAYVPQDVTLAVDDTVADVLGIGPTLAALRAIEAGSTDPAHYDAVGEDWLVEDRARAVLASLGLGEVGVGRTVGQVSGGEATLLSVGAALLARPDVLLLDEPTNNLDADARELLAGILVARPGATAVVTHDRALLERVERIGEMRERPDRTTELRWFGGGGSDSAFAAFEDAVAVEQEGVRQAVSTAKADAARERRDLLDRIESAGQRRQQAASARANAKVTRAGVKVKTDQAARTEARTRHVHEDRLAAADARLEAAKSAVERDRSIRVELPGTEVPRRRSVAKARGLATRVAAYGDLDITGPERIVVSGRNGSGKTTLLETLLGLALPVEGSVDVRVPAGYLPQRLDLLDDSRSVIDNVQRRAPGALPQEVQGPAGPVPVQGRGGRGARWHPVGRRALPRGARLRAAGKARAATTGAR